MAHYVHASLLRDWLVGVLIGRCRNAIGCRVITGWLGLATPCISQALSDSSLKLVINAEGVHRDVFVAALTGTGCNVRLHKRQELRIETRRLQTSAHSQLTRIGRGSDTLSCECALVCRV